MAHRPAESYSDQEFYAREAIIVDAQIEIQRILETKNISQAELAKRMGVKGPYINRLISGPASNITLRTYASIMHHLEEEAYIGVTSYISSLNVIRNFTEICHDTDGTSNIIEWDFSRKNEVDIIDVEIEDDRNFCMPTFSANDGIRSKLEHRAA